MRAVLRVVHLHERLHQVALHRAHVVGRLVAEDGPGCIEELVLVQLHLEDVGVLGEHVERIEVRVLHPVHGILVAEPRGDGVEEVLVGETHPGEECLPALVEREAGGIDVDGHCVCSLIKSTNHMLGPVHDRVGRTGASRHSIL